MKNKEIPDTDEFYVGYLPKAPRRIASVTKRVILILFVALGVVASITALEQKEFSTGNFEFNLAIPVEGYLFSKPVPHMQVPLGKDILNKELYQTILLVGYGKAGANNFFSRHAQEKKEEGAKVRLRGTLIYGHGKTLLQVDEASNLVYLESEHLAFSIRNDQKEISVSGEIVDPKCFFGVMKPGGGKSHRSCAIRCISGGIPPVFKTDSSGYFILVNENNNEAISTEIVNIIGDKVVLEGKRMHLNDWQLLQVDPLVIRKHLVNKKWREKIVAFEGGVTTCN
jgi:hypothetical protein